jgi:2-polyprenyl-3-methyl-5-hydroxy-6-metoxy-1,4-benzoquinol methylase
MDTINAGVDFPDLRDATREIWEKNAEWWDARMGEGDRWHRVLIAPSVERLLNPQPGEAVLDLACGNGWFARRLAALGVHVVACDFSPLLLQCARARSTEYHERIDYQALDLSDQEQLAAIGTSQFDAAVCNMGLMDMASITPLLKALHRALKPGGRFVFSVPHPCFNSNGSTLLAERDDYRAETGQMTFGVRVNRYLSLTPEKASFAGGQPSPHYYFHRPISTLLRSCFAAGFVLDGLEEPAFAPTSESPHVLSWTHCRDIPPVLVGRLRVND